MSLFSELEVKSEGNEGESAFSFVTGSAFDFVESSHNPPDDGESSAFSFIEQKEEPPAPGGSLYDMPLSYTDPKAAVLSILEMQTNPVAGSAFDFVGEGPSGDAQDSSFDFISEDVTTQSPSHAPPLAVGLPQSQKEQPKPKKKRTAILPGNVPNRFVREEEEEGTTEVEPEPPTVPESLPRYQNEPQYPSSHPPQPSHMPTPPRKASPIKERAPPKQEAPALALSPREDPPSSLPNESKHKEVVTPPVVPSHHSPPSTSHSIYTLSDSPSPIHYKPTVQARLNEYESELGKWDDRIKEIDNSQMELNKRKNECYLRLIEILNNQKQIEATQIQLSECDKFAEAEQLDEKLQSLQDEIRSIYQEIGKISKNWIVLEDEKCAVYGKLTTLRKEGIKKLKNLEEEQEEVVEEITRKIKQEREEMEFNIGSKIQRIDRDLEHIKVDLSNLTDKQQKIMVMVKERTASQCTEKEIYSEKLGKLKEEIASLLARLDMLRREESHCQEKLDSIDTEINTASQRYQSELKAIEQDRQKTLQEQSQLNLKKTDIQREKAKYDRALQSLQTTGNNEKQVLVSISKSIGGSREMIETFDSLLIASQRAKIKAEHLFEQEIEETTELKLLRVKQLDYTEQIRNYSASILKLHSEINNFEQAIKLNQETSLPNLEAEKKLTVSNRDFKGAQIIHKQIVTLKEQVEEMSTKKKQSEMVLSTTVENRKKCQTAYEDIKKHIEIKEKEQDMKNLALITERIRELENGKQAAKSKAEINKIESELEITINKSKYIQFKHNLEKNPYANPNNATEVTVAVPTEIPTAEKFEPVQTEIPNTENLTPEQIETKISALKEDIIQLESQIEVAISQDDFVKADELQQQINDKTKVIAALQSK